MLFSASNCCRPESFTRRCPPVVQAGAGQVTEAQAVGGCYTDDSSANYCQHDPLSPRLRGFISTVFLVVRLTDDMVNKPRQQKGESGTLITGAQA